MAIATDQHRGMRPVAPQVGQEPDQDHGIFGPGRTGAWTQGGGDEGMRRPFKNEEREISIVLIVMIIERTPLLTLGGVVGVVEITFHSI
jgi:hypothetical protein